MSLKDLAKKLRFDVLIHSLTSTFSLFRKLYKKFGRYSSIGSVNSFVKEVEYLKRSTDTYLEMMRAQEAKNTDPGVIVARNTQRVCEMMLTRDFLRSLKRGLRSNNDQTVEMFVSNTLASCLNAMSYVISRSYRIESGSAIKVMPDSVTKRDLERISSFEVVQSLSELEDAKALASLIDRLSTNEPKQEDFGAFIAAGIGIYTSMVVLKLVPYFYFHARVTIADQLEMIAIFLNSNAATINDDKVAERQRKWAVTFEKLAKKIDIETEKASNRARRETEEEVEDMDEEDDGVLL